jgi:hypothetical protein
MRLPDRQKPEVGECFDDCRSFCSHAMNFQKNSKFLFKIGLLDRLLRSELLLQEFKMRLALALILRSRKTPVNSEESIWKPLIVD